MINKFISLFFIVISSYLYAQDYTAIEIDSEIENVQPMTGIVFWPGNSRIETDAISLEYSYMSYADVVKGKGVYDWTPVEELLDEMASRNHQAVLRFRFSYPGRTTTVPQYIKDMSDYNETMGKSEGRDTSFPDWTHPELKAFTIDFYTEYAKKYDKDPRMAFVQTGFGLWAEYHIYDGPFKLGETFPSKEFQTSFMKHLDTVFQETYWSISIDAASSTYSPFSENPDLKLINFGLFDDSFMHKGHSGYNTTSWNFFDRDRYKWAPAGGEFSYYTDYDQENVLNEHVGAHGIAFETFVENFRMSYINGNDQGRYQEMERIKAASMYMGYRFKINSFQVSENASIVEIENVGVAPFYYDAYVAVNGVRASESLKLLNPGEILTCEINSGGDNPVLTIESDRILPTQTIEYYGTINEPYVYVPQEIEDEVLGAQKKSKTKGLNVRSTEEFLIVSSSNGSSFQNIAIFDIQGRLALDLKLDQPSASYIVDKNLINHKTGLFIIRTELGQQKVLIK